MEIKVIMWGGFPSTLQKHVRQVSDTKVCEQAGILTFL